MKLQRKKKSCLKVLNAGSTPRSMLKCSRNRRRDYFFVKFLMSPFKKETESLSFLFLPSYPRGVALTGRSGDKCVKRWVLQALFRTCDLEWTHLSFSMDLTSDLCALKAPCLQKTFF